MTEVTPYSPRKSGLLIFYCFTGTARIPCFLMDLYNVFIFKSEWTYVTDYVDFCRVLRGLQIAEYSVDVLMDQKNKAIRKVILLDSEREKIFSVF